MLKDPTIEEHKVTGDEYKLKSQQNTAQVEGDEDMCNIHSIQDEIVPPSLDQALSSIVSDEIQLAEAKVIHLMYKVQELQHALEEEQLASQKLRRENDELVNDNQGLLEDSNHYEEEILLLKRERDGLKHQVKQLSKENEDLEEEVQNSSVCSRRSTIKEKVEDLTVQMQIRLKNAFMEKFTLEQHLNSIKAELDKAQNAAECLLKERNAFRKQVKLYEKHCKKCSCQDPLVFDTDVTSARHNRVRRSLPDLSQGIHSSASFNSIANSSTTKRFSVGEKMRRRLTAAPNEHHFGANERRLSTEGIDLDSSTFGKMRRRLTMNNEHANFQSQTLGFEQTSMMHASAKAAAALMAQEFASTAEEPDETSHESLSFLNDGVDHPKSRKTWKDSLTNFMSFSEEFTDHKKPFPTVCELPPREDNEETEPSSRLVSRKCNKAPAKTSFKHAASEGVKKDQPPTAKQQPSFFKGNTSNSREAPSSRDEKSISVTSVFAKQRSRNSSDEDSSKDSYDEMSQMHNDDQPSNGVRIRSLKYFGSSSERSGSICQQLAGPQAKLEGSQRFGEQDSFSSNFGLAGVGAQPRRRSSLISNVTLEQEMILEAAVIDLAQKLGTPFGQKPEEQTSVLREALLPIIHADEFERKISSRDCAKSTTASGEEEKRYEPKTITRKRTGYKRWTNSETSGTQDDSENDVVSTDDVSSLGEESVAKKSNRSLWHFSLGLVSTKPSLRKIVVKENKKITPRWPYFDNSGTTQQSSKPDDEDYPYEDEYNLEGQFENSLKLRE